MLVLVPVLEAVEFLEKGAVAVVVGMSVAAAPTPVRMTVSVGCEYNKKLSENRL